MTKRIFAIYLFAFAIQNLYAASETTGVGLDVMGWPLEDLHSDRPGAWLSGDPIIGRLACPALLRLNLSSGKVDSIVVDNVATIVKKNGPTEWAFRVKSGIFWWNQDPVTAADLGQFLEENLQPIVALKSGALWTVPAFKITIDDSTVRVVWKGAPKFGPYILTDYALWRKASAPENPEGLKFECAGAYKAISISNGYRLEPSIKYGAGRQAIRLLDHRPQDGVATTWMEFVNASHLNSAPVSRAPDRPELCKQRVDLPYLTVIEWNSHSRRAKNPEGRKQLAGLIPKGTLLRSGSGSFGDLISGPIPRHHPGYNSAIKVGKFGLGKSATLFADANPSKDSGLSQPGHSSPRMSEISLGKLDGSYGIVEKVLMDSFSSAGIQLEFLPTPAISKDKFDGFLYTARLPGPEMNFLPNFDSKIDGSIHKDSADGAIIDSSLEGYLQELSNGIFNPLKLKDIHQKLETAEFVTVILHHSACLVGSENFGKTLGSIDVNDPDWFRRLVIKN